MDDDSKEYNQIISVLEALPGYVFWRTQAAKYAGCNAAAAKLLGYDQAEDIVNTSEYDMPCQAAKAAEIFIEQNTKALDGRRLLILDIHPYCNNEQHVLLVEKFPIYKDNKIICAVTRAIDIADTLLDSFSSIISQANSPYLGSNKKFSQSLTVNARAQDFNLSKREAECLFYLIRGMTMKAIGKILGISERTVENHIAKIKDKFDCRKKDDLIQYCLEHNLYNLVPESLVPKNISLILNET